MTISDVSVPYPDFKLLDVIEPDQFDLNNSNLVSKINAILVVLNQITDSITVGSSGADKISLTAIAPFTSVKLQAYLQEVVTRLQSITDSTSGADFIGSTGIVGVTGTTVQAQLESLKSILDSNKTSVESRVTTLETNRTTDVQSLTTHKTSGDHDTRYYTKTEVDGKVFDTINVADRSITSIKVALGSITTEHLANQSVTADKINPALLDTVAVSTHRTTSVLDHPDLSVTYAKLNPDVTSRLGYGVTTNVANAYSITLSPVPSSYTDGMSIRIKVNADSTGVSTLNVNALGAKPLRNTVGNDVTNLKVNGIYTFVYNATTGNFILQGEGVDASTLITAQNTIFGM